MTTSRRASYFQRLLQATLSDAPRLGFALIICLSNAVHAEKLSIERLFAAPDLSGTTLRAPQISPDGHLVTYLRGSDRNKDRLDLWAYDLLKHEHRLLVAADRLAPEQTALSPEEEQRRERQRTSSLSGIIEYEFSADSRYLLVPLGGDLYVYDLHAPAQTAARRLPRHGGYETDAKFSPQAHYVSFIRDQNLIVYKLATGQERAITSAGTGPVSFGTAEFIAQEEMSRSTGYWWSPDEKHIAFTRVDESRVPEVKRFEIYADTTNVVTQRYPAAGTTNATVQLFVASPAASSVSGSPNEGYVRVDLGPSDDVYLARVNWFPDSSALAIQRESRDQTTLTLLHADPVSGASHELLREHSDTWIELNDNLTFLSRTRQFIWASSRTGFQHLYLYDWNGQLVRPLTQGEWQVTGDNNSYGMRGVDEIHGLAYYMSNEQTPLERHLYSVSLTDPQPTPRRITAEEGWHSVSMSSHAQVFLDTFSTPDRPPSVILRSASGAVLVPLVPNEIKKGHPYAPYFSDHLPVEFGTLRASDGQTLYYQMTRPRDLVSGQRYPVIVDVYGGPGAQRVRKAWGSDSRSNEGFIRQYLAQNGYIVFTLDNRGSGWRGARFETALYHHLGSVEVQDQVAGVQYLKSLPFVDSKRIGVFGWSYGGYMALMCMLQAPETFAAGVSGAPVTAWKLYDTHYTERFMSTPQSNPDGYERSSVMYYADRLRGPLLIMHGMADDNVLFTNSTTLFKKLQELNKPFDIMTYPGSKHALLRHADTGPHALMTMKRFFDRSIGPGAGRIP